MPGFVKVSGTLEGSVKSKWSLDPLAFEVPISATAKLRGSGGVGVSDLVAAEVWLEGAFATGLKFSDLKTEPEKLELSIAFGGTAYALVFKAEKEFYRRTFDLLRDDPAEEAEMALQAFTSGLHLLERDYLATMNRAFHPRRSPQGLARPAPHTPGVRSLESPTYPLAEPAVSGNASQLMLLWLHDDLARGPYDRTEIVWSVFNGQEWSAPIPLADDGTADFKPQVVLRPDGSAVAAWENQRVVHQPNSPELAAYASQLEVSVAHFDPDLRRWSKPTPLRAGDFLNAAPKVAVAANGEAVVTWTAIRDNDLTGLGGVPHEIWFSRTTAGQWSSPSRVATFMESILRTDLAFDGNRAELVVSADSDRNLLTVGDRDLYRLSLLEGGWTERTRLTEDSLPDENPKLGVDAAGTLHLFWLRSNEVCSVAGFQMAERQVIRKDAYSANLGNFKVARGVGGALAVVWAEPTSENSSDLHAVFPDPLAKNWSYPKVLTRDPGTEGAITAAFLGTNTLSAVYTLRMVAPAPSLAEHSGAQHAAPISPTTGLAHLLYEPHLDLAIDPDNLVVLPENPAPGSTISLWPDVVNLGDLAVTNVAVALVRNETEILARTNLSETLRGGERREIHLQWELPASSAPMNLAVVIDPESRWNDIARDNNRIAVTVVQSDLSLQSVAWTETATNTLVISAWVLNRGNYPSGAAQLVIRSGSKAGPILGSQSLGALATGDSTNVLLSLDLSTNLPPASLYVGLVGEGTEVESNLANNETVLTLRELVPPTLSASVRPADGALEVIVQGGPGTPYRVQISTDLRQWDAWTNIVTGQRTTILIDSERSSGSQRFYRAILDP